MKNLTNYDMTADAIRSNNSGMCSGEPRGIRYPNIPSVGDILDRLGLNEDDEATDEGYDRVWDAVAVEEEE